MEQRDIKDMEQERNQGYGAGKRSRIWNRKEIKDMEQERE